MEAEELLGQLAQQAADGAEHAGCKQRHDGTGRPEGVDGEYGGRGVAERGRRDHRADRTHERRGG